MGPLAWLALAGVNAAMSASKSQQAAKQRKMEAEMRAAEIEAAPWTGRGPSTQISTPMSSLWADMAGAGVNTLGQAAALQQAGLFSSASPEAASPQMMVGPSEQLPSTLMYSKPQTMWGNMIDNRKMIG